MDKMEKMRDGIQSAVKGKYSQSMSNSKGYLHSQLKHLQDDRYKNLLDLFNDQDAKEGTFSLVDVQV
jgi:hypothetical protein